MCTLARVSGLLPILLVTLASARPAAQGAEELIKSGHYKRARAIVQQRLQANPNDAETLWLAAWIKQIWGDRDAALEHAQRAVAAKPRDARYRLRLAEIYGDMAQKAGIFQRLSLVNKFKQEIDATLAIDPANVRALRDAMEYYMVAPSIAGGNQDEGRKIPDRISRINPVEGLLAQIWLVRFEKQNDRIEPLYRRALEIDPNNFEVRASYGTYLTSDASKKYPEAEQHGRAAVRIAPDRAGGYTVTARALAGQRKWKELDQILVEAEKAVPDNLAPYYQAAQVCLDGGVEPVRSERYVRKYLGIEPEAAAPGHARARWLLGRALAAQGRTAEAVAEYKQSVQMDPNSPAKDELARVK